MAANPQMDEEMQEEFKLALQEGAMQQLADQEMQMAEVKTAQATVELGVKPQNVSYVGGNTNDLGSTTDYIVKAGNRYGTFGRTTATKQADGTVRISTPPPSAPVSQGNLNPAAIIQQQASGQNSFNIESELGKLRTITNPAERQDAAQLLLMNIDSGLINIQGRIRSIAAQRAGVNNAQLSLDQNLALDIAAVKMGKIKPGETTIQTQQATAALAAAMGVADKMEKDYLITDPEARRLDTYRNLVVHDFKRTELKADQSAIRAERDEARAEDRRDRLDSQLPVMTDQLLNNVRSALGIKETDRGRLQDQIKNTLVKDKALQQVANADKNTLPLYLVSEDPKVRQYAYNIIANAERELLELNDKAELPDYIKQLEKLVADPGALLTDLDRTEMKKPTSEFSMASGNAEKSKVRTTVAYKSLINLIDETAKVKYQRMDLWAFTDPQFKAVVDSLKVAPTSSGKVLMSDGVDALVKADMKNPDNSSMNIDQKIGIALNSLKVSMRNDKESMILPTIANYYDVYATDVRNAMMRAFIYNNKASSLVTGFPLSRGYELGAQR